MKCAIGQKVPAKMPRYPLQQTQPKPREAEATDEANRYEAGAVQISQVLHNLGPTEITAEFLFIYYVRNAGLRRGRR